MHFLLLLFLINFSIPYDGGSWQDPQQEVIYDSSSVQELEFDKEKIASYKEDPAFDYTENVQGETWWTKFKRYLGLQWNKVMNRLFGNYEAEGILLFFLKVLPYLIITGILFFVIWLFRRLNPAAAILENPSTNEVLITEEEEIIQSRDISKLIDAAVNEEKYNLAIRYQYLYLLRLLTKNQIISYESSKTNAEYSMEISSSNLRERFNHLSWIYDYTWYGSFEVDQQTYMNVEKKYGELRKMISEGNE